MKRELRLQTRAFDDLWMRVYGISAFCFDELSPDVREVFKRENKSLEKAVNRWLEKLYSRPSIPLTHVDEGAGKLQQQQLKLIEGGKK